MSPLSNSPSPTSPRTWLRDYKRSRLYSYIACFKWVGWCPWGIHSLMACVTVTQLVLCFVALFQTTGIELLVKPVNIPDSRDQVVSIDSCINTSRLKIGVWCWLSILGQSYMLRAEWWKEKSSKETILKTPTLPVAEEESYCNLCMNRHKY